MKTRTFEPRTDEEAMAWITEMLGKSDRKFELVHIID